MSKLSPQFISWLIRLALAGAMAVLAVPIGFYIYLRLKPPVPHPPVRNFSADFPKLATQTITVSVGDKIFVLKGETIRKWAESYTRAYSGRKDVRFSPALSAYIESLAEQIDSPAVNAKLQFQNGKATIFSPSEEGNQLNTEESADLLRSAILRGENSVQLPVENVQPAVTLASINQLGITDLLSRGESDFSGSSPARIHNIKTASSLFNGIIISPGASFSFNTILGSADEINASHGYEPEKVIKHNKLAYEYGGGICQVSTTLFRAVILSGLKILERHPHAFPVKYYNPQGFDATIYPGVSDMRFKNNTPDHILIQTKIKDTKLAFEIYGTSDGRKVTMEGPFQYDQQPDSSMKAYFNRLIISADGGEKTERFNSSYKSPDLYPLEKNPYE